MKNKLYIVIPTLFLVLTVIAWFAAVSSVKKGETAYNEYLDDAEKYEASGVYYDALLCYRKADEIKGGNYGILYKIAEMTAKLGYSDEFGDAILKVLEVQSGRADIYELAAGYYCEQNEIQKASGILERASEKGVKSEEINRLSQLVSRSFSEIYVPCDSLNDFVGFKENSLAVFSDGEKAGLIRSDGKRVIKPKYVYVGMYDAGTGLIPVCDGDKYFYIDTDGNTRLVPEMTCGYAGSFGNGLAPVKNGKIFSYTDRKGILHGSFRQFAGPFYDGAAAVCDGMWYFIGSDLKRLSDDSFDYIMTDSYGFCSRYGLACVMSDGVYYIYSLQSKKKLGKGFADIRLPASDTGLIAVREKDCGTWSFADREGKIVLRTAYTDAESFSCGFAPCSDGEKWGYIDVNGDAAIDFVYSSAGVFSDDGTAAVALNGSVFLIALSVFK